MRNFLYVALSCVLISLCQAQTVTQTLSVAVVEGSYVNVSGQNLIKTNVDRYLQAVDTLTLKAKPVVIVFPEYGLTGRTDNKSLAINSTDLKTNEDLKYINEKSKTRNNVIVASFLEVDGDDLYSTTLVFNGTDNLMAKYRKINLNKNETNLKSANEVVTFKVEKPDLTIGLLSGDDILYEEPANKIVNDNKANLIIYTSSMASTAPFKTSVSLHAGFAKAHGVNLLVASLNDPENGISGSGIYSPCSSNSFITATPGSLKAVSAVIDVKPNVDCKKSLKDILLFGTKLHGTDVPLANLPRYNLDGFQLTDISSNTTKEVCDDKFCCQFNITASEWKTNEFYKLAVHKDEKVCGFMSCQNKDNTTCGRVDKKVSTVFTNITINTSDGNKMFVPYILHSDLTPKTDLSKIVFNVTDSTSFNATGLTDIIAVAIVGAKSGASTFQIFVTGIIAMIFLVRQM